MKEKLKAIKARIAALAGTENLTAAEAKSLEGMLVEAKQIELQIKAAEYGAVTLEEPEQKAITGYAAREEVDNLSKKIDQVIMYMENTPAYRSAGHYSVDGGGADKNIKSFGDFALAIYRNDTKRLTEVYGAQKDLATQDGSAGGFLVPAEIDTMLMGVANSASEILPRVQTVPVGSQSGTFPALDQYITPTAGSGQTADAAGVKATVTEENTTLTETNPQFIELQWRVKKIGGYTNVPTELMEDSPLAIDVLLTRLFGIAVAAQKERNIINGNGAAEYLGILKSPVAVGIAPDTDNLLAYDDVLEILSRFRRVGGVPMLGGIPVGGGAPVFLAHQGLIPDIGVFEIGTSGAAVPTGVGTASGLALMPGTPHPIIYSEHMPQDDNAGCLILADLSAYLVFQRGALSIAYSEHAAFKEDQGVWRFTDRSDGMPWVKGAKTLADPTGSYTVSPFVYLND